MIFQNSIKREYELITINVYLILVNLILISNYVNIYSLFICILL